MRHLVQVAVPRRPHLRGHQAVSLQPLQEGARGVVRAEFHLELSRRQAVVQARGAHALPIVLDLPHDRHDHAAGDHGGEPLQDICHRIHEEDFLLRTDHILVVATHQGPLLRSLISEEHTRHRHFRGAVVDLLQGHFHWDTLRDVGHGRPGGHDLMPWAVVIDQRVGILPATDGLQLVVEGPPTSLARLAGHLPELTVHLQVDLDSRSVAPGPGIVAIGAALVRARELEAQVGELWMLITEKTHYIPFIPRRHRVALLVAHPDRGAQDQAQVPASIAHVDSGGAARNQDGVHPVHGVPLLVGLAGSGVVGAQELGAVPLILRVPHQPAVVVQPLGTFREGRPDVHPVEELRHVLVLVLHTADLPHQDLHRHLLVRRIVHHVVRDERHRLLALMCVLVPAAVPGEGVLDRDTPLDLVRLAQDLQLPFLHCNPAVRLRDGLDLFPLRLDASVAGARPGPVSTVVHPLGGNHVALVPLDVRVHSGLDQLEGFVRRRQEVGGWVWAWSGFGGVQGQLLRLRMLAVERLEGFDLRVGEEAGPHEGRQDIDEDLRGVHAVLSLLWLVC